MQLDPVWCDAALSVKEVEKAYAGDSDMSTLPGKPSCWMKQAIELGPSYRNLLTPRA